MNKITGILGILCAFLLTAFPTLTKADPPPPYRITSDEALKQYFQTNFENMHSALASKPHIHPRDILKFFAIETRTDDGKWYYLEPKFSRWNPFGADADNYGDLVVTFKAAISDFKEILGHMYPAYTGIGFGVKWNENEKAIEVDKVFEGTPAAKAGLKKGDFVVAVDGRPARDEQTMGEILDSINDETRLGESVTHSI